MTNGEDLERKNRVIKLARHVKRLIKGLALLLFLVFGWLRLRGVPVGPVLGSVPAELILKASLVLYYLSWVGGTLWDTNVQELVYVTPPNQGRLAVRWVLVAVVLAVVFGVLCYVNTVRQFVVFLASFLVINILTWQYLVRFILPESMEESRRTYEARALHTKLLELEKFLEYLTGKWQWYRFIAGLALVLLIAVLAFSRVPVQLADRGGYLTPDSMVAMSVLLYVLVLEVWIWYMRFSNKVSRDTILEIGKSYGLEPTDP